MIEKAQHDRARGPDILRELHRDDPAFGNNEAHIPRCIDIHRNGCQNKPVAPVQSEQRPQPRRLEFRQRHGLTGQPACQLPVALPETPSLR